MDEDSSETTPNKNEETKEVLALGVKVRSSSNLLEMPVVQKSEKFKLEMGEN